MFFSFLSLMPFSQLPGPASCRLPRCKTLPGTQPGPCIVPRAWPPEDRQCKSCQGLMIDECAYVSAAQAWSFNTLELKLIVSAEPNVGEIPPLQRLLGSVLNTKHHLS